MSAVCTADALKKSPGDLMDPSAAANDAASALIAHSVVGAVLCLCVGALVVLVMHLIKNCQRERERFHRDLQEERNRAVQSIHDFNEFTRRQTVLVDRVCQENRETRTAFGHALDQILSAIKEKI